LKRLVEEVRDLRRVDSGKLNLLFEHDAPEMLLGHILEQSALAADSRGVRILTGMRGDLPQVRVDRRRTLQALAILVERALAVTGAGGRVTIQMHADADDVIVSVSDDGPVPDPRSLERLFDQFWTDPLERGGHETPLRLALARSIVESQGGRVWAAPRDAGGLTICCSLPRAPESEPRTPE
jgi:signal transduction histidine kinase